MEKMFPTLNLIGSINNSKLNVNQTPMRLDAINSDDKTVSFADTVKGMANDLNNTVNEPDKLMEGMLAGDGTDIHDVINSINKAEISVTVATQVLTKIVQAYDKIMQIQI
jgi:flagellar hook-basal body complex protein FliE